MSRLKSRALATVAAGAVVTLFGVGPVRASVSYNTPDAVYSQNFDSLPNSPENASLQSTAAWTDDTATPGTGQTSILGWYLYHPTASATEGGVNQHQRLRAGAGTSTTGAFYSFGTSGSTNRALGALPSSTIAPEGDTDGTVDDTHTLFTAFRVTNNTGATLTSFTVGYTGEQWHVGTAGDTDPSHMVVSYSLTATAANDPVASFTNIPALEFKPLVKSTTEGAVDGTTNRTIFTPVTISGLNWAPGTDLWIRFNDPQLSAFRDDGLAVDDFSFSASAAAVPEPACLGLAAVAGVVALGARRRRRR
jgi:hypothetical protein